MEQRTRAVLDQDRKPGSGLWLPVSFGFEVSGANSIVGMLQSTFEPLVSPVSRFLSILMASHTAVSCLDYSHYSAGAIKAAYCAVWNIGSPNTEQISDYIFGD